MQYRPTAILLCAFASLLSACSASSKAPGAIATAVPTANPTANPSGSVTSAPTSNPPGPALLPPSGLTVHNAGDVSRDIATAAQGGVLLAGGGADNDAAMQAFVDQAARGDIVVLRMDDTGGGYANYLAGMGAHSVRELVFDAANGNDEPTASSLPKLRALADDAWIEDAIAHAEGVFFAGGNQSKYVDAFAGTKLARALDAFIQVRGVVGGTSAGMHLLGGLVHTPRGGDSVTSDAALADPYIRRGELRGSAALEFTPSAVRVASLAHVLTDTHWSQRNRLGRSITFLARLLTDQVVTLNDARMITADERVALLLAPSGIARVFGPASSERAAYFFKPDSIPADCTDNRALDWPSGVPMIKVIGTPAGTSSFDITTWQSATGIATRVRVQNGSLSQ